MRHNLKVIILLFVSILLCYGSIVGYFLYKYYNARFEESLDQITQNAKLGASKIQSQFDSYLQLCNSIECLLIGARQQYGYNMMPYVEKSLGNLALDNSNVVSANITWEYSVVNPYWLKPFGRYKMTAFVHNGVANIKSDTLDLEGEVQSEDYYRFKNGEWQLKVSDPYFKKNYETNIVEQDCFFISTRMSDQGFFLGTFGFELPITFFNDALDMYSKDNIDQRFVLASNRKIVHHDNPEISRVVIEDAFPQIERRDTIVKLIDEGRPCSSDFVNTDGVRHRINFYPVHIDSKNKSWTVVSMVAYNDVRRVAFSSIVVYLVLAIIGFFLLMIFGYFYGKRSSAPFYSVVDVLDKLQNGNFKSIEMLRSDDEDTEVLFDAVNDLKDRLEKITNFAISISKGRLNKDYHPSGNNDILGNALLDLKANLIKAKADEKKREQDSKKLSWSQNGVAQLGELLRQNNADIKEFAYNITSFLVNYLGASQGGLFVSEQIDDKKILELKAAFAYDRKKELTSRVEFGESMVGRCAIERKTIYITEVPEGYLYIASGLGERRPASLLLVPLLFEDDVMGVLEIASIKEIEQYQITFFDSISERIASTISSIQKNISNANLLEKYSTQSAELDQRQNAINMSMEEVKNAQKEIRLASIENKAIIDIISNTNIIYKYDMDSTILDVRDYTLSQIGLNPTDVLGKQINETLLLTKDELSSFNDFWAKVVQGRKVEREFVRGNVTYHETYSLIKDDDLNAFKVVSVATPLA